VWSRAMEHPELPDVFTLGECATGEYDVETGLGDDVSSGVHLYYGSFLALSREYGDFDWEGELWETITHEIRHHRESAAGEDDLEEMDYAEDENFRRREGEHFDPLFFRAGEPAGPDRWEVDDDLFIERIVDARELATLAELRVEVDGVEHALAPPGELGDVHFLYLLGARDDDTDVALVLVRRRGAWESLRGMFGGGEPRVLESEIELG
ncbi:MAG: metallopeptidase family protein, partial [Gemmatimonadetes bacterium]|nr:metallopeptidase family protein [Gemmatimonadota bacterium]